MDKLVDFSQPIEVYCFAGVAPARVVYGPDTDGDYRVDFGGEGDWKRGLMWFRLDGESVGSCDWKVRNVGRGLTAKPSTPSNEELTQRMEEARAEAVALVHEIAARYNEGSADYDVIGRDAYVWMRRADALKASLPKPVDPIDADLIEARAIVASVDPGKAGDDWDARVLAGEHDDSWDVRAVFSAVKRGREIERRTLAAGGTAHE